MLHKIKGLHSYDLEKSCLKLKLGKSQLLLKQNNPQVNLDGIPLKRLNSTVGLLMVYKL